MAILVSVYRNTVYMISLGEKHNLTKSTRIKTPI
jgi:hypothetical protein